MARGLGVENIYKINEYATQGIMPDVTFLLDLPAKTGIGRKKDQKELDRMELESIEFHEKVAQGYRDLAKLSPERIYTVDAAADIETVSGNIIKKLQEIL
jgi:dTMP kinase